MKYGELIYETSTDNTNTIIMEFTKKCKPFLNQVGGSCSSNFMYRGTKGTDPRTRQGACEELIILPGSQPHRTPRNSTIELHNALNKAFIQLYHIPFRNGTFVNGSVTSASIYGNVNAVIPLNEFHFLWSPDVSDLFSEFNAAKYKWSKSLSDDETIHILIDRIMAGDYEYQTTDLLEAIKSGNEIMLYCDNYFSFNPHDTAVRKALDKISKGAI